MSESHLITLGVLALFSLPFIIFKVMEKRRSEALQQQGALLGYSFSQHGSPELARPLETFPLFVHAVSSSIKNLMERGGVNGNSRVMDLHIRTGRGKKRSFQNQTIYWFHFNNRKLPSFYIRIEYFIDRLMNDKVKGMLGYSDLNLPDFPEFSKAYIVCTDEGDAVAQILRNSGLPKIFTDSDGYTLEVKNSDCIIYKRRGMVPLQDLSAFISHAERIVSALNEGRAV